MTDIYDPGIRALLNQTADDWGDPEENREFLVPYGIEPLNKYLYGIDIVNGELILVMGQEKRRKTTFAINIVVNYMTDEEHTNRPITVIDTLESGMTPVRYRDQLIANLASRWLLAEGHFARGSCSECGADRCRQLKFTPEFLRYHTRTPAQKLAIDYALDTMASWPLYIFGANPYQGGTRNLQTSVRGGKTVRDTWQHLWASEFTPTNVSIPKVSSMARWEFLIKEFGAKIFVSDHVQQYSFANEISDYEKQLRAVSAISDAVAVHKVAAIVLSQVSLTSVRESRTGQARLGAMGGSKLAQEANVAFSTHYDPDKPGSMTISLEESRKSGMFHVITRIEDRSGAFYGTPELRWNRKDLAKPLEDE
jgi:hypothetical protein